MKKLLFAFAGILMAGSLAAQSPSAYLKMAAENNPGLKAKYNLYLAALEAVDQSAALPDPTLSFGYFISPVETRVGPQRFRFSLSQMFPWKGTLPLKKQAAALEAEARYEEFMEAKNEVFLQVKLKWLRLFELEKEISINEENLELLKTYEPVTKTKYEANLVSLADLVRVQINIGEASTKLDLLKLKRYPLHADFNLILNREVGSAIAVPRTFPFQVPNQVIVDSLVAVQPNIKAAQAKIKIAETYEELSDKMRKPNLGFGLDYAFVGKRTDQSVTDNGKDILMPMFTMSLPVFGKKNRAAKKSAQLRTQSMEAALEERENRFKSRWFALEYKFKQAEAELVLYQDEIEKTNLLLRVLTTEYTNNNRDFEEVLATQQRLLALRLSEVKARVLYQAALYEHEYFTTTTLNEFK